MRLFVAVDIDPTTRAALASAREVMRPMLDAARVPPRITWVREDVAHVTVRFIGEVPDVQLRPIQDALSGIHIRPFEVTWGHVGAFGGRRNPRVLWLAPSGGGEAFDALAKQINDALDPVLGPGEDRPFTAHLTLGRVRDPGRGVDWGGALAAVRLNPTVMRVEHVTVYQSRLSPKGPTYTALSSHG